MDGARGHRCSAIKYTKDQCHLSFPFWAVLEWERFLPLAVSLSLTGTIPGLGRESLKRLGWGARSGPMKHLPSPTEMHQDRAYQTALLYIIRRHSSPPHLRALTLIYFLLTRLLKHWALLSYEMTLNSVHFRFFFVSGNQPITAWMITLCSIQPRSGWSLHLLRPLIILSLSFHWFLLIKIFFKNCIKSFINWFAG